MIENTIMLDASVAVELMRKNAQAQSWIRQFDELELSVVVFAELQFGAVNSLKRVEELGRLQDLVATCSIVDVDVAAAKAFAELKLELQRRGKNIPQNDLWIASVCVSRGARLASLDKHFISIPGLAVLSWRANSDP